MYCLSKFCFLCLNAHPKLLNINSCDSDNNTFLYKLGYCSIDIEFAVDILQINICGICCDILRAAFEFKKKCLVNNKRLTGYINQLGKKSSDYVEAFVVLIDDKYKQNRFRSYEGENTCNVIKSVEYGGCLNNNVVCVKNVIVDSNLNKQRQLRVCLEKNEDTNTNKDTCANRVVNDNYFSQSEKFYEVIERKELYDSTKNLDNLLYASNEEQLNNTLKLKNSVYDKNNMKQLCVVLERISCKAKPTSRKLEDRLENTEICRRIKEKQLIKLMSNKIKQYKKQMKRITKLVPILKNDLFAQQYKNKLRLSCLKMGNTYGKCVSCKNVEYHSRVSKLSKENKKNGCSIENISENQIANQETDVEDLDTFLENNTFEENLRDVQLSVEVSQECSSVGNSRDYRALEEEEGPCLGTKNMFKKNCIEELNPVLKNSTFSHKLQDMQQNKGTSIDNSRYLEFPKEKEGRCSSLKNISNEQITSQKNCTKNFQSVFEKSIEHMQLSKELRQKYINLDKNSENKLVENIKNSTLASKNMCSNEQFDNQVTDLLTTELILDKPQNISNSIIEKQNCISNLILADVSSEKQFENKLGNMQPNIEIQGTLDKSKNVSENIECVLISVSASGEHLNLENVSPETQKGTKRKHSEIETLHTSKDISSDQQFEHQFNDFEMLKKLLVVFEDSNKLNDSQNPKEYQEKHSLVGISQGGSTNEVYMRNKEDMMFTLETSKSTESCQITTCHETLLAEKTVRRKPVANLQNPKEVRDKMKDMNLGKSFEEQINEENDLPQIVISSPTKKQVIDSDNRPKICVLKISKIKRKMDSGNLVDYRNLELKKAEQFNETISSETSIIPHCLAGTSSTVGEIDKQKCFGTKHYVEKTRILQDSCANLGIIKKNHTVLDLRRKQNLKNIGYAENEQITGYPIKCRSILKKTILREKKHTKSIENDNLLKNNQFLEQFNYGSNKDININDNDYICDDTNVQSTWLQNEENITINEMGSKNIDDRIEIDFDETLQNMKSEDNFHESEIDIINEPVLMIKKEENIDVESVLIDEQMTDNVRREISDNSLQFVPLCLLENTDNYSCEKLEMGQINKPKKVMKRMEKHVCQYCDKVLSAKSRLLEHMRSHSNLRPFVCQICFSEFKHKRSADRHMRRHTNQK